MRACGARNVQQGLQNMIDEYQITAHPALEQISKYYKISCLGEGKDAKTLLDFRDYVIGLGHLVQAQLTEDFDRKKRRFFSSSF